MYDVNQWEDQPVGVVLGAIGAAAALGVGFTFLWHAGLLGDDLSPVDFEGNGTGISWTSFLVLVLLVPIVGEVLKEVGPILLARRPAFDDMIDGLTFGVAAGAAFAAAETIVVNRGLFSTFGQVDSPNAGFWVSLILSAAVVKPIVYGAATGIAVASFSGLGAGLRRVQAGLLPRPGRGPGRQHPVPGRTVLHRPRRGHDGSRPRPRLGRADRGGPGRAAALPAPLRGARGGPRGGVDRQRAQGHRHGTAYCPSCEMPLLAGANFCVVCGTSVRAGNKITRARNRTEDVDPATAPPPKPSLKPTPAGVAPQDNKTTALVVLAVVAAILIGGVLGQVAASVAADEVDEKPPADTGISIDPDAGGDELGRAPAVRLGESDEGEGRSLQAAGSDKILDLGDGVLMLVPKGFRIDEPGPGFVQVFGFKGYFFAYLTPKKSTLPKLITNNLTGIQNMGVQNLRDHPAPGPPGQWPQGCGHAQLPGLLATQQGGRSRSRASPTTSSAPTAPAPPPSPLYGKGSLKPKSKLVTGYNTMLNTLVSTL